MYTLVIKTKVVIKDNDVTEGSIVNWLTSEDWAMSDENKPLEFPLPGGLDCPAWCGPPLDSLVTCVTWSWNTQWITAVSQETVTIAMVDHGVNVPCPRVTAVIIPRHICHSESLRVMRIMHQHHASSAQETAPHTGKIMNYEWSHIWILKTVWFCMNSTWNFCMNEC